MTNLKLKLEQRLKDRFFGFETSTLLQQFPPAQALLDAAHSNKNHTRVK